MSRCASSPPSSRARAETDLSLLPRPIAPSSPSRPSSPRPRYWMMILSRFNQPRRNLNSDTNGSPPPRPPVLDRSRSSRRLWFRPVDHRRRRRLQNRHRVPMPALRSDQIFRSCSPSLREATAPAPRTRPVLPSGAGATAVSDIVAEPDGGTASCVASGVPWSRSWQLSEVQPGPGRPATYKASFAPPRHPSCGSASTPASSSMN